jgi:hypothetical protein
MRSPLVTSLDLTPAAVWPPNKRTLNAVGGPFAVPWRCLLIATPEGCACVHVALVARCMAVLT